MEYFIVNESNNYYLDVGGGSKDIKAEIIVTPAHYNPSQRWRIQGNSIISSNSNYVIDICHGENKGSQIIQYKWHNGSNQKWYFYEDGTIRSEHGLCLKANYDNKVVSSEYTGFLNQKWRIVRYEQARPMILNLQINKFNIENKNLIPIRYQT